MKEKASPYHNPEKLFSLMKIALQKGSILPEQTGIKDEFPEEFMDIESPAMRSYKDMVASPSGNSPVKEEKNIGTPGQGRPKNSKDTKKRDQRTPKPLGLSSENDNNFFSEKSLSSEESFSSLAAYLTTMAYAKDAQATISEIVTPLILKLYGKKSLRQLSSEQSKKFEKVKFSVLCNTKVFDEITKDSVKKILAGAMPVPQKYEAVYSNAYTNMLKSKGEELSMDEMRNLQATAYSMLNCTMLL